MLYRREVDGLRAVAILPVIFFHAGFKLFEGGFIGVDVFFVVSGYLITTIILSDMQQEKFSIITFYERRARRILPALFFVMFCCLPFAWFILLPNHYKDFSQSLAAVSVFSSNILFWRESGYFATVAELKPLLHTWSLAIEEQYYLFFPLFLMMLWKLRKRWIFGSLVIISIVSLVVAQWGAYNKATANFFLLPTRGWELAIGALIAFYFLYWRNQSEFAAKYKAASEVLGLLGLLMIGYAIFAFDKRTPFPSFYALVPTVGTALIIIFSTANTLVGRLLGTRGMVGIGLISYSTYLWHQPLFAFARHYSLAPPGVFLLLGLSLLSIVLAYLSWKFVENPFRNKNVISRKTVFTFAVFGSIFFLGIGLAGSITDGFIGRYDKKLHSLLTVDENQRYVPKKAATLLGKDFERDGKFKILLIGDSHAEDLVNAVYENGYDAKLSLSFHKIAAKCGNLYLKEDFSSHIDPSDRAECRDIGWYESANLKALMKQADLIWLVSSWDLWQAELIGKSVDNIVSEYGDKVVVFGAKHFGEIDLRKILATSQGDPASFRNRPSTSKIEVNDVMKEKLNGRVYVDLLRAFCGVEYQCRVVDDNNKLLTFDGGHLTKEGAIYFGKLLAKDPFLSRYFTE